LATAKVLLPKMRDPHWSRHSLVSNRLLTRRKLMIQGHPRKSVLVKNPAGFRLSLESFVKSGRQYMIAINDHYAMGATCHGCGMWIWIAQQGQRQHGQRAARLRHGAALQYDEFDLKVEPRLAARSNTFCSRPKPHPKSSVALTPPCSPCAARAQKYTGLERVL